MATAPSQSISISSGTHQTITTGHRERFGVEELACVMSHYDVGVIRHVKEFPRGSRKAPKLLIDAEAGQFLLKRRARGRDDAAKVAYTHLIQLRLAQQQFPLPHLIGTRRDNNSMLQWGSSIYELFEYIPGQGYPANSLDATADAGRVLALYHKLLDGFHSDEYRPAAGSYHNAMAVEQGLKAIPAKRLPTAAAAATCAALLDAYRLAVMKCESLELSGWPAQTVHGDWHPGNMLFRDGRVVAVIDYDSARELPRIIDAANGALQFSIVGGDEDVANWPDALDEARFKRFVRGYDGVLLLSQAELDAAPWLMVEALIAEAVFPIAATGNFSRFEGAKFLAMVRRKTAWIAEHATRLVALVGE